MSLEPTSLTLPIPFLSVKVICFLVVSSSFQPDCLYSTERECFLNLGKPFFPLIFFLQLSKNLAILDQARSADDCLALEFNSLAKLYSLAIMRQYLFTQILHQKKLIGEWIAEVVV